MDHFLESNCLPDFKSTVCLFFWGQTTSWTSNITRKHMFFCEKNLRFFHHSLTSWIHGTWRWTPSKKSLGLRTCWVKLWFQKWCWLDTEVFLPLLVKFCFSYLVLRFAAVWCCRVWSCHLKCPADLVEKPAVNVDWVQFAVKDEKAASVGRLIVEDCMGDFSEGNFQRTWPRRF